MRKLLAGLSILLAALIAWYIVPGHQTPSEIKSYLFTISTDGPALPGYNQEFLINAFSRKSGALVREPWLKIGARLKRSDTTGQNISESLPILPQTPEGTYICNFCIPENQNPGSSSLEIYPAGYPDIILCKSPVQECHDNALVVIPPKMQLHAGNWVSFKIASICRKNGAGNFKVPIRVKMMPPSGHTTINRVLFTDIDGIAVFTSHINNNSPVGIYTFDFFQGNEKLQLKVFIGSQLERLQSIKRLFDKRNDYMQYFSAIFQPDTIISSQPLPLYNLLNSPNTLSSILYEIRAENDQAFLSYDCKGSEYRQIEVWQNGKVVYNSDLQLDSGRIAIPFPHGIQAAQPIFFKLWQLRGNELRVQEQGLLSYSGKVTPALKLLADADLLFATAEQLPFNTRVFTRPGLLAANLSSKVVNITTRTEIDIKPIQTAAFDPETAVLDPVRLIQCDEQQSQAKQRFFLVDNELQLNRFRFSTIKIWLDPYKFLTSAISALLIEKPGIDFMLGEIECRTLRCGLLGLSEQPAELEKLEGLLIPVTEFYEYSQLNKEIARAYKPMLARAISRLSKLIHVPEKLASMVRDSDSIEAKIGPFSPILPSEINIDRMFSALKPGGKASLVSGGRIIPINLTGNVAIFQAKSLPGKENRIEKLINSRSTPILVELEFSEDSEY